MHTVLPLSMTMPGAAATAAGFVRRRRPILPPALPMRTLRAIARHELSCAREPGNFEPYASMRRAADAIDDMGHAQLATMLRTRAWNVHKALLDAAWRRQESERARRAETEAAAIERMRKRLGL